MAAQGSGVVLEAFLVGDDYRVLMMVVVVVMKVALENTVGERDRLSGLDPSRGFSLWFRRFRCWSGGYVHG